MIVALQCLCMASLLRKSDAKAARMAKAQFSSTTAEPTMDVPRAA